MSNPDLSAISGRRRRISPILLQRARELRLRQTSAEEILWECLRARRFYGYKFRRQHNIGRFIADFYCHECGLVVEVDGSIHDSQFEKDAMRDAWMESVGLQVLRVRNWQVFEDLEGVLVMILERWGPHPPAPSPRRRRGVRGGVMCWWLRVASFSKFSFPQSPSSKSFSWKERDLGRGPQPFSVSTNPLGSAANAIPSIASAASNAARTSTSC